MVEASLAILTMATWLCSERAQGIVVAGSTLGRLSTSFDGSNLLRVS